MLEQATALVVTYHTALMIGVSLIGVVTATIWTIVTKQRKNPPSA